MMQIHCHPGDLPLTIYAKPGWMRLAYIASSHIKKSPYKAAMFTHALPKELEDLKLFTSHSVKSSCPLLSGHITVNLFHWAFTDSFIQNRLHWKNKSLFITYQGNNFHAVIHTPQPWTLMQHTCNLSSICSTVSWSVLAFTSRMPWKQKPETGYNYPSFIYIYVHFHFLLMIHCLKHPMAHPLVHLPHHYHTTSHTMTGALRF